jgi:hypothetical protein
VTPQANQLATMQCAKVDLTNFVLWSLYFGLLLRTLEFSNTLDKTTKIVTQRANQRKTKRSAKVDFEYFGLYTLFFRH